jgi:hypothetical protein
MEKERPANSKIIIGLTLKYVMQTTLRRTEWRRLLLGALAALAFGHALATEVSQAWPVSVGRKPSIVFDGKRIRLAQGLMAKMRQAEEASFLPYIFEQGSGVHARWLVLRSSSRIRGGAGYCGAGHEDRLLLVEVSGGTARGASEFLAQSCLKSVSMDFDEFNELISALSQNLQNGAVDFQQTRASDVDAFRQKVRIQVIDGKARIETTRIEE